MKIAAVDDDRNMLDLLQACLENAGYRDLTVMNSSKDALDRIAKAEPQYECILLDIQMPGKDGITLCREIRALPRYQNVPILMITSRTERSFVDRAFSEGATDYITKPFDVFEIGARVRVAEKLVQERRAALDSYLALKTAQPGRRRPAGRRTAARASAAAVEMEDLPLDREHLMALPAFETYLNRATCAEDCDMHVFAVRVADIDLLFSNSATGQFVDMLRQVLRAIAGAELAESLTISHMGNGTFLCAGSGIAFDTPDTAEMMVLRKLDEVRDHPAIKGHRIDLSVGEPFALVTGSPPNFERVLKVSNARLENRCQQKRSGALFESAL